MKGSVLRLIDEVLKFHKHATAAVKKSFTMLGLIRAPYTCLDEINVTMLFTTVAETYTYVVSSCVLYPLCVLYVSKKIGNNIKREENMNKFFVYQNTPTPLFFFLPIYILQFEFVKYKKDT